MANECKPSQDSCTKGGTGPSCSQSGDIGGAAKQQCLEFAKESCEEALKDCVKKCTEELEDKRISTSSLSSLVKEYYERNKNPSKNPRSVSIQYANPYGVSNEIEFKTTNVATGEHTLAGGMQQHAECMRDCYYQASSDCQTTQCYCGSLKCGSFDVEPDGRGTPAPPETEPPVDEPWSEEFEENQLTEVSFETASQLGLPIELVFSRAFLGGNVIWISEPTSSKNTSVVVSRDYTTRTVTTKTITNVSTTVSMFIGLCAGSVDQIASIRVDDTLVYDAASPSLDSPAQFRLLRGTPTQKVSKRLSQTVGFGRAPAHRDLCYVECVNLSLTQRKEFPKFNVEVVRNASSTVTSRTSDAVTGKDSARVWTIDGLADRLYVGGDSVKCIDLETLETVYAIAVEDAVEVTPLGRIVAHTGSHVRLYERGYGVIGEYPASFPASQTFVFRTPGTFGTANLSLVSQDSGGSTSLEEISEVSPAFPTDAVAIRDLASLDTSPHSCAGVAAFQSSGVTGDTVVRKSIFMARVGVQTYDTIILRELRMLGEVTDSLLEDEEWYEYAIAPSVFGNTSSLVLYGLVVVDDGLLLFTADNNEKRATLWHPDSGIVWTVVTPEIPSLARYSGGVYVSSSYKFLAADAVHTVDTSTGVVTSAPVVAPSLDGFQLYDSAKNRIIYESAGDTITVLSLDVPVAAAQTLSDVVEQVSELCGIDATTFDLGTHGSVEIMGYRSGGTESAANILQTIFETHLLRVYEDSAIVVYPMGTADSIVISAEDVILSDKRERVITDKADITVSAGYLDATALGEEATQTFSIDMDGELYRSGNVLSRSWSVLSDADSMRRLAEVYAYILEESRNSESFILPPRYIGLTPGDYCGVRLDGRVTRLTLGANNFISVETVEDSLSKYGDDPSVYGVERPSNRLNTDDTTDTLPAPMAVPFKGVAPTRFGESSSIIVGLSNLDDSFDASASVARTSDELTGVPSGRTFSLTESMLWGRLVALPTVLGSEEFRTFKDQSVSVRFPTESEAIRAAERETRLGAYPDPRLSDLYYNLLIVGQEVMQYGYASRDGSVVTFRDLMRCRHNTDPYKNDHTIGELVVLYTEGGAGLYEFGESDAGDTVSLSSFTPNLSNRRFDVDLETSNYAPCDPGYVIRTDIYEEYKDLFGVVQYTGYATELRIRTRTEHPDSLTDDTTDLKYTTTGYVNDYPMYLIRGVYNEALFDAARYTTDTSYIFKRIDPGAGSVAGDGSIVVTVRGREPIFGGSTIPVSTIWDYYSEPLSIVLIHRNDFGETRTVLYYPTDQYTTATRALLL